MLGRRQIREKVLQYLYAIQMNGNDANKEKSQMLTEVRSIQQLYFFQLSLFLAIHKWFTERIEIGKNKKFPTEEELQPNYKFVQHPFFELLEKSDELQKFIQKHKEFSWDIHWGLVGKIGKDILSSKWYDVYMHTETDFDDSIDLIKKIFKKYIAPREELHDLYSDFHLSWGEDFFIANSLTAKSIKDCKEGEERIPIYSIFKDEDDEEFLLQLYSKTYKDSKINLEMIDSLATNWKIERIALIDRVLLQMAITEIQHFQNIPHKVVINEYIELSKYYSTPKSSVFINGILDKYIKNKSL